MMKTMMKASFLLLPLRKRKTTMKGLFRLLLETVLVLLWHLKMTKKRILAVPT